MGPDAPVSGPKTPPSFPEATDDNGERQAMMALYARATRAELEAAVERFSPLPQVRKLRPPEAGLVMVQGRTGGDGAPFNMGEATVTRAAVQLEGGATGVSYMLGRAPEKAKVAAILDALWQDPALKLAVNDALAPIRRRLAAEEATAAAEAEATKVNFFTMTRGED
ncbi:phosphonate C-P lyase system protein PhnG [Xanthobacter versatilis]|uniref:phosphonate C-P lyase system protein PhnG n=1 Tax=Xanthobacter autotrophicus (strain ATCC BAA-1158 / Py2) TaxID=78245 RepID=UPI003727886D